MELALIAPTNSLDRFAKGRPVQFCLAQVAKRDQTYLEWYKNQPPGVTVILDNGAYEGELLDFDDLLHVAFEIQPEVLVMPDVMGDAKMTTYLHNAFRSYFNASWGIEGGYDYYKPELMAVLQGGDIWDLIKQYGDVPEKWVGFPRNIEQHTGVTRSFLCDRLEDIKLWQPERKHHALGFVGGNWTEMISLANRFHSVDTSSVVWRSLPGAEGHFNPSFDVTRNHYYNVEKRIREVDTALGASSERFYHPATVAVPDDSDIPF